MPEESRTNNRDLPLWELLRGEGPVLAVALHSGHHVRPDVERDKTSTSYIVRPEEVQALPGIRDIGDLLSLQPDVIDGHFRGGRQGEEYYSLQGMGIMNPLDNSSAFTPIMSGVEEVEVITSGFGAQYGNAQSGVVRISMREGDRTDWYTRFEARMYQLPCCGSLAVAIPSSPGCSSVPAASCGSVSSCPRPTPVPAARAPSSAACWPSGA